MTGKIYLKQGGDLVPMYNEAYDSEDLLQSLLESHPDLLAGEQMDSGNPRRWLLVKREARLPDGEDAGDRWAVDHFFLDQEGIPTLVEVKRSSDSRLRREVVGQMLDYAANAVAYFPVGRIREAFNETCMKGGAEPNAILAQFLTTDTDLEPANADLEAWWNHVGINIQAGKIRMVFVADQLPSELKRIVEFLNGQMNPAEVLAVEISQYVGGVQRILVPRVFGLTAEAQGKKGSTRQPRSINAVLQAISASFNAYDLPLKADASPKREYSQLKQGLPGDIHYEWLEYANDLMCAVHFENDDREINEQNLNALMMHEATIKAGVPYSFEGELKKKWASAGFRIPKGKKSHSELSNEAAYCMKLLVERTYQLIRAQP